ncbi:MAG: hypothetical protein Q4E53_10210 [Eubacteriales bacterium]|nr:hypothetical protein [Eubacteriales bacterium]
MKEFIYDMIYFVSRIHTKILNWNDVSANVMTDKQLHFWVMGLIGMALLFVIYPLFILLAKKHVLVIAWIYVFTLMVVIAFALEIEQGLTGTGVMDFSDATSGLSGFMWMFFIFAAIRMVFLILRKVFRMITGTGKNKNSKKNIYPSDLRYDDNYEYEERKTRKVKKVKKAAPRRNMEPARVENEPYRRAHTATFHSI